MIQAEVVFGQCSQVVNDKDRNSGSNKLNHGKKASKVCETVDSHLLLKTIGNYTKIINENVKNPVSLTPIGYKLVPHRSQMLLAKPASWHWRRSEFCESPIWVTKWKDRQPFPTGDYTNQSLGGTGIKSWLSASGSCDAVRNEDIVIWHTYGFTHNPRVEDFPIMPAEMAQIRLSPYNFCLFNPTNDVPPSNQGFNKSIAIDDAKVGDPKTAECCKGQVSVKSHL